MNTKIILKIVAFAIVFIVALQGCSWIFNHLNPWAGIISFIVVITCLIILLVNNLNILNKNKNEKK